MRTIEEYNLIFIHIPKAAGTVIRNAFKTKCNIIEVAGGDNHESAYVLKKEFQNWNLYKKFTVIRNPWELELSHFFFTIKETGHFRHLDSSLNGFSEALRHECPWRWHRFNSDDERLSHVIWDDYKKECEKHLQKDSFARFLFDDETNELLVDDVLRFENLNQDWIQFCDKNKLNDSIREYLLSNQDNKSQHRNYSEYYTEQWMIDLVAERHKDYIEYFNYDF